VPLVLLGVWWLAVGHAFGPAVGQQGGFGIADPRQVVPHVTLAGIASALWTLNLTWWGLSQFERELVWPAPVYVLLLIPPGVLLVAGIGLIIVPPKNDAKVPARARRADTFTVASA